MFKKSFAIAAIGAAAVIGFAGCSDDDDDDATPSPSPSAAEQVIHVVCPDPVGTVDVTTPADSDQWYPAKVVGKDQTLTPVAFGEVTFTNSATGKVESTDPPVTKPGADTTGAIDCTFTIDVEDTDSQSKPVKGTVAGPVTVLVS